MPSRLQAAIARSVPALLTLLLAGCQLAPRTLTGPEAIPTGDWAVVNVRPGPVGVRDPGEAVARHGQWIHFEPTLARSGDEVCTEPRYLVSLVVADHYLRNEIGVRATGLGLYRWQDLRLVEVFCKGKRWHALGGETIIIDYDRAYAVRDDTLYQLRRLTQQAQ